MHDGSVLGLGQDDRHSGDSEGESGHEGDESVQLDERHLNALRLERWRCQGRAQSPQTMTGLPPGSGSLRNRRSPHDRPGRMSKITK